MTKVGFDLVQTITILSKQSNARRILIERRRSSKMQIQPSTPELRVHGREMKGTDSPGRGNATMGRHTILKKGQCTRGSKELKQ
jgi:hypothetical protein